MVALGSDARGVAIVSAWGSRAMEQSSSVTITLRVATTIDEVQGEAPRAVDFTVLQINDVYEVTLDEGPGGLDRVATLREAVARENSNCLVVLAGDFLSPSVISTTIGDGGRHMIETLNAMGLTHATVGNHEFDLAHEDFLVRIEESQFKWVLTNVSDAAGAAFPGTTRHEIVEFSNAAGETARVALIGLCLDLKKQPWVRYDDPIASARAKVAELEGAADVVIALTHLQITQDEALGVAVPRLDVLMGGHEHEAARAIVGDDATPIFKADSNARSALVHRFRFDTRSRVATVHTQLVPVDDAVAREPATRAVIERWQERAFNTLRAQGFEPTEVVGRTREALIGYESDVRNRPTNLTRLVAGAFLDEVPGADAVMVVAGTIRIDGEIAPGDVRYFDIVRMFPSGGALSVLSIPGVVLEMFLNMGLKAKNTGSFQIHANIERDGDAWMIGGEALAGARAYTIVFNWIPAAALAHPPFKGSGIEKLHDTREIRAIVADRFRRDAASGGG